MNVLVIGGMPAGTIIDIPMNVSTIELSHRVPMIALSITDPPYRVEKFNYEVHPITLTNTGETKPNVFGIAVPAGKTLVWGMQQLMSAYQRDCQTKKNTDKVH